MEQFPRVGVGIIVRNGDKILLGKRLSKHGYGFYSLPGGKLEYKESVIDCARRELLEESNLQIDFPVFAGYTDDVHSDSGLHYVTLYIEGDVVDSNALSNTEPDKVEGWQWYGKKELPTPLWHPVVTLFRDSYLFCL